MLNLFIVLSAMFFSMLFFGLTGWLIEAYCSKQEHPDSPATGKKQRTRRENRQAS